ncbi:MAG TPA: hypothetical protein VK208_09860 [Pyrinomonadaceae bacterium]|jgi:hypothetical protein|nr:hypothetical protein [Pyrinomonadaceae bacterium]
MWIVSALLTIVWLILKFVLHKGGYVHILIIAAISISGVQLIAHRKTQYHKTSDNQ